MSVNENISGKRLLVSHDVIRGVKRFFALIGFTLLFFLSLDAQDISSDYLRTQGSDIVDSNGNVLHLHGVNIGGWLVTEGWMCGQRDASGRGALEQMEARFGDQKASDLMKAWQDNWFTTKDLDKIQSFGANVIRVPFSYRNLQNARGDWILNDQGDVDFSRFDWVVNEAAKRNIYVIFDFHVWPRQLEKDGYGLPSRWSEPGKVVRAQMAVIWTRIAKHFRGNGAIAAFDVINEPEGSPWDAPHHAFYDAIRSADPNRIVMIEWVSYPNFLKSGWKNVIWSPHYPESSLKVGSVDARLNAFDSKEKISSSGVKVPIFVGECKAVEDTALAARALADGFNQRGWNWAVWTYKGVDNGGWAACNYDGQFKYDLASDSYDALMKKFTVGLQANPRPTDWWIQGFRPNTQ